MLTQHLLCTKYSSIQYLDGLEGTIVEAGRSVEKEGVRMNIEEVKIKDLFIDSPFS